MKCVKCGKEFNPTINADMDSYYSFKMGMCKESHLFRGGRNCEVIGFK